MYFRVAKTALIFGDHVISVSQMAKQTSLKATQIV
jgi:hypothetical protein